MRAISRVVPVIIAGTVGVGVGLGIGLLAASHGSVAMPGNSATTSVASSAQWGAEGAQLVRASALWEPIPPPRTVTLRGKRYFQVGFTVFGFSSPYSGYRTWIY